MVVLHYLVSGHSHMNPDVVTSHCKHALKKKNLYHPSHVAEAMNKVANVKAEFIDHNSSESFLFEGWSNLLNKYFDNIPTILNGGYTSCHFFEITKGQLEIREVGNSEEIVCCHSFLDPSTIDLTRKAILKDLFGDENIIISDMRLSAIQLNNHQIKPISAEKAKSFSLKKFAIPEEFRYYYPLEGEDTKENVS